jgi:hypothetical protein
MIDVCEEIISAKIFKKIKIGTKFIFYQRIFNLDKKKIKKKH